MRTIESGYELDRFSGVFCVRWWLFLFVPGGEGRPQRPRLGVTDHGFRFARGGRVGTPEEAQEALRDAYAVAEREFGFWRGQPSHALGRAGELVPLDAVLPKLPAA